MVYLLTLDLVDFTYSSAMLTVWSVLEPTLGIVNACLPLIRPATDKLFRPGPLWYKWSTKKTKSEHRWPHGPPGPSSPPNDPRTKDSQRLYNDSYPLENVDASRNLTTTSAEASDLERAESWPAPASLCESDNAIKVISQYCMRSSPGGYV